MSAPALRFEQNLQIPLPDGVTLVGDLRIPAAGGPYPALLSTYPYRKDDLIGAVYEDATARLARRGYASLLVDFRGHGGASGRAAPAMDASEADDLVELVAWVAAQPWCDGSVGVWGLSYGGITALKAAAARPPALRAVAPIMASDDIYGDWFYPGGCRNMLGAFGIWGTMMLALHLAPPLFNDPGGRWREAWRERLEGGYPYLAPWLEHPHRDAYWASRAIPIERIEVPTFLIGGWRDIFPEAMVRIYRQLRAPSALLMGPWLHTAPDASPFERVDHVELMGAFFDRWLRGDRSAASPDGASLYVQGAGWRHDAGWPPTAPLRLYADADHGLGDVPGREAALAYRGDPTVGVCAGLWEPLGTGLGLPLDQGPDDLRSLTFTGEPLADDVELVGSPQAFLRVVLEEGEELQLVVKLCEVTPDGRSSLVTSGWLNAAHRDGHGEPVPVPTGEAVDVRVGLWASAYRLAAGSRLRLSIACSDFPRVWPSATNPLLRVLVGGERGTRVEIPVAAPGAPAALPRPDPAENRMPALVDAEPRWEIEQRPARGEVFVRCGTRLSLLTPARDGRLTLDHESDARVRRARPDAARVQSRTRLSLELPCGQRAEVDARGLVVAGEALLEGRVVVDGQLVFEHRRAAGT